MSKHPCPKCGKLLSLRSSPNTGMRHFPIHQNDEGENCVDGGHPIHTDAFQRDNVFLRIGKKVRSIFRK